MHLRFFRAPLIAVCAFAIALAVPSPASAHEVNTTASSASCTLVEGVPTVTLTVEFQSFGEANMPVTGTISLDGTVVQTYADASAITWTGSNFTLVFSQTTTAGTHVVTGDFTWPEKTAEDNGTVEQTVECPAPPTTPPDTTPPATTPPAGGAAPSITPPSGGVLPETAVSGRAALRGPSGCVETAFRARVTGRSIASVRFYVDGRLVKRMSDRRTTYTVKVRPQRLGFGRHRVMARVRFVAESNTAARTLRLTFRRCAQGAAAPRFTG